VSGGSVFGGATSSAIEREGGGVRSRPEAAECAGEEDKVEERKRKERKVKNRANRKGKKIREPWAAVGLLPAFVRAARMGAHDDLRGGARYCPSTSNRTRERDATSGIPMGGDVHLSKPSTFKEQSACGDSNSTCSQQPPKLKQS